MNFIQSFQNYCIKIHVTSKALFGTVITDPTTIEHLANLLLTARHAVAHELVDCEKGMYTIRPNNDPNSVVEAVFKTCKTLIGLPFLPAGYLMKYLSCLDPATRKRYLELIELKYEELKKRRTLYTVKGSGPLSKLPRGIKKLILTHLDIKTLGRLALTNKTWALLCAQELKYQSLDRNLKKIFTRNRLLHVPKIYIPMHRACSGYQVQRPEGTSRSSTITVKREEMGNAPIAMGRDPWGRPYLSLQLTYSNGKETALVLHPLTPKKSSSWVCNETPKEQGLDKHLSKSWTNGGFESNEKVLNLIKEIVDGKKVPLTQTLSVQLKKPQQNSPQNWLLSFFYRR